MEAGSLVEEVLDFQWSLFHGGVQAEMLRGALILKLRGEYHLTDEPTNLRAYHMLDFVLGTGDG